MKRTITILAIILFVTTGCKDRKQAGTLSDSFIKVDVEASYPKKELILQNFMDVEYIPLETSVDFLCQGIVLAIGKEFILVKNRVKDGNIFIFDRNGKSIRKINRKGNGSEEYTSISELTLDEHNGEIFVNDIWVEKIFVYDLFGKFKRSIKHKEGINYFFIYNYDRDKLICNDNTFYEEGKRSAQSFFIISKQDGSIIKEIKIPFKQEKSTMLTFQDGKNINTFSPSSFPIIPHKGNWIFMVPSSDTVFNYSSEQMISPFIIRTPSIQSMEPEVFLFPSILTDQYYFMETAKKEYNIETGIGFPRKKILYEIQDKTIYEYTVNNDDYEKRTENMSMKTINDEIAFWDKIEASSLIESYEKGLLKGKLKEIAAELDEDSNPVIMLVKYKNK